MYWKTDGQCDFWLCNQIIRRSWNDGVNLPSVPVEHGLGLDCLEGYSPFSYSYWLRTNSGILGFVNSFNSMAYYIFLCWSSFLMYALKLLVLSSQFGGKCNVGWGHFDLWFGCRRVGKWVECEKQISGRISRFWESSTGCLWCSFLWMGLLDSQKCERTLGFRMEREKQLSPAR